MAIIKSSTDHLTLNADGASKDIKFQANGSEKVIIKSDGSVGVGTSTPGRKFAVSTDGAKTDTSTKYVQNLGQSNESSGFAQLGLYFKGNSSTSLRTWQVQPSSSGVSNDGIVEFNADGGQLRANRGIWFGTDTAAANALDDYEEGEHIVSITSASGSITEHSSYNTLRYTKIGDTVTVSGRVDVSSVSSPSGALTISLPFATPSGTKSHSAVTLFIWAATASETGLWIGWLEGGSPIMYLRYGNSGTPVSNVSGYIQAGTEFRINVTYKTA